MRLGGFCGWLALCGGLCGAFWAATAHAQPVIVDPDPDPAVDWDLRLEPVVLEPVGTLLASPSALVFFGPRADETFLVLEKDTGKVRHFVQRVEQAIALDLAVDTCGERGLVGIALHPSFDPRPTPVTDPETERPPSQDWVYLSYHSRASDGCDVPPLNTVLRVERYHWTGTALVPDPLVEPDPDPTDEFEPFVPFERSVAATTAVGGVITTGLDLDLVTFLPRLYVAIGSLERDGRLQNNELAADPLDENTGVILRLDENGETPDDNPFDHDADQIDAEDRYFAYGIRDPRGLAVDPFFTSSVWFTELSDAATATEANHDEIGRAVAGANGGYRDYQGRVTALLPNSDPNYALVDLDEDADGDPVSTYLNPPFSFEDKGVEPTGLAFGGREVGPRHLGSLFVGGGDGRLLRYAINAPRSGFVLADTLTDTVADAADDLTQILVGTGFGAISDVETGLDGSIYVLSADGAIHHVFSDARRDLALSRAKVPTRISLSAKKPKVSKRIRVTLENRGDVAERIVGRDDLVSLLGLEISALAPADCAVPSWRLIDPKFVLPPFSYIVGLKPKGKLKLSIAVEWECASPSPKGSFDFETRFELNGAVIGIVDENPDNDVCPRAASGDDKGCGKRGAPLQTDVVQK